MAAWNCPACGRAIKQRLWYCPCGSDYRPGGRTAPARSDGGLFTWHSLLGIAAALAVLVIGIYYVFAEPYATLQNTELPIGWLLAGLGLPLLLVAMLRVRVFRGVLLDLNGR
jgi:hypothetical protein